MRFLKMIALFSVLMISFSVKAATINNVNIVFNDLGDVVTVSEGATTVPCGTESGNIGPTCTITLTEGSATITARSGPPIVHLAEPNTAGVLCAPAPNGGAPQPGPCISDGLNTSGSVGATSAQLVFQSDSEPGGLPSCSTATGGCQFVEDGSAQEVQTITWSDGTVDHIKIQSDVEPEPATLALFGSGLVMAGTFIRRRRVV
jgi:hypothetical protein